MSYTEDIIFSRISIAPMQKRVLAERMRAEMTRCLGQARYSSERVQLLAAAVLEIIKPLKDEDEVSDAALDQLIAKFSDLDLTLARERDEKKEAVVQGEVTTALREQIRRLNPFS